MLFLREMSLSRCKWKGVGKTHEIKAKTTNDSREGAAYLADLVICRPMKFQGAIEVVQNLRACLDLRLPDGLLLPLVVVKFRGWGPGLDDCPVMGPLGCPFVEHLFAGRHKLGDLVGGA